MKLQQLQKLELDSEFDIQANKFLEQTNTAIDIKWFGYGCYFTDDKKKHDIYTITLTRGDRSYKFNFGQSINKTFFPDYAKLQGESWLNSKAADERRKNKGHYPTAYDILSCLQKSNPGTFEEFCSDFGYDTDSIKANRTYAAVVDEYLKLCTLFNEEELQLMQEIQ